MPQNMHAKVFVSCGQREDEEDRIAKELKRRLEDEYGFKVFLGSEQVTLEGVKENIFPHLESSEYFLFVDFKRDQIGTSPEYVGSLFSHQELAIATYLNLPLMSFREEGVRQRDGILGVLMAKHETFSNRAALVNMIMKEVKQKIDNNQWSSHWKNQLTMEREPSESIDTTPFTNGHQARYFHIRVHNLNPYKRARNCYAFLEKVCTSSPEVTIPLQTIEFKWAGYSLPNATILPSSFRELDGFFVFHNAPRKPHFSMFADYEHYAPHLLTGQAEYKLTYLVVSDDFLPIRSTFRLRLSDNLDEIIFEKCEGEDEIGDLWRTPINRSQSANYNVAPDSDNNFSATAFYDADRSPKNPRLYG